MRTSSTSPFRSAVGGMNRAEGGSQESMTIMLRSLEKQNNTLAEEVAILRNKNRKIGELEEKIDLVLKHNNQLLNQNQKVSRLIVQKKSEVELWKSKFDSQSAAKSSTQDIQIKRLLNEVEKLKEEICEVEHLKNVQINQLKNQNHAELQHIKRNNLNSTEMYQLEIRKLKQQMDRKEHDYSQANLKLVRANKQLEFEVNKVREERERLKQDLMVQQNQHKRDLEAVKAKLQANFHNELQNLKKQHYNEVQSLDYENSKLKDVISSKNSEIEQMLHKNAKVKQNYDDSFHIMKRQNDGLKDKIIDNQRIFELELSNLRQKLQSMRESEIGLIKNTHSNQVEVLSQEIAKLQAMVNTKNIELENLVKQKNQIRLALEAEISKLRSELELRQSDLKRTKLQHLKELEELSVTLKNKNDEIAAVEHQLTQKIEIINDELEALKPVLQRKSADLEHLQLASTRAIRQLLLKNQQLNQRNNDISDELDKTKYRSNTDLDDHKKLADLKHKQFEQRIRNLDEQNLQKQKTIDTLKSTVDVKDKEINALRKQVQQLEGTVSRLKKQLEEAKNRNANKQKQYNNIIKEQRDRMEANFRFQLQNNRSDSNNVIAALRVEIKDLKKQIQTKNGLLDDLRKKYEELVRKFQELFAQQAQRKDLDIKKPGWIPQVIATKGLFDVFLKNKVIEYCT